MCQSKSEGGRRCAAHNNQREFARSKRELKNAVSHRDSLITARDSGNPRVTEQDIAAAEHDVLVRADLALLMDPKFTDEQLESLWENASLEVQAAARPVAQSIIQHGKAAAKLSGQAATERMFDRTEEAEQFEDQAEEERSKALRLVDALRAALTDVRTAMSEGVRDTLSGDETTVGGGIMGALRDFASETGQALREGVTETADALHEGLLETVENLAAGVGISAPTEVVHGEQSPDGGESASEDEHESESCGNDVDTAAADDNHSTPSTIASPSPAPALAPAQARDGDIPAAEASDGDSASDGRGLAEVKGQDDSQADKSHGNPPSSGAGARRTPAPGIGHGKGVTSQPQPVPVRRVGAETGARVLGTPQKAPSFDITKLSDSELLSFISRLYEKLRT